MLIAESQGEPVGYAVVQVRGPEETWATGDRVAQLETLAVLPGHRNQGIGSALVERMHEELRRLGEPLRGERDRLERRRRALLRAARTHEVLRHLHGPVEPG